MTARLIMLTVLGLTPEVQVVPLFTWIDSWDVRLRPNCSIGGNCGNGARLVPPRDV